MATRTITLKVTPAELKIIEEALALYRWIADRMNREAEGAKYLPPPPAITIIDGRVQTNKAAVDKLIKSIA